MNISHYCAGVHGSVPPAGSRSSSAREEPAERADDFGTVEGREEVQGQEVENAEQKQMVHLVLEPAPGLAEA